MYFFTFYSSLSYTKKIHLYTLTSWLTAPFSFVLIGDSTRAPKKRETTISLQYALLIIQERYFLPVLMAKKKEQRKKRESSYAYQPPHLMMSMQICICIAKKNCKKLIMRDTAKRTHMHVRRIEVSSYECISKQTKIDLDNKIKL